MCTQQDSSQILHWDQTRCEENIYRVADTPGLAKIFGDANADVHLFGVANLLVNNWNKI